MIRFPVLEALGVQAALMTDQSDGDFSDDGESLRRLCEQLGLDSDGIAMLKQVHGIDIHDAASIPTAGEGDGLIMLERGQPMAIRIADCVPVFLVDAHKPVAALLHAGWRGTLAGIAKRGVEQLCQGCGCKPEDIHAVIGPSACPDCYEVSAELAAQFTAAGYPVKGRFVDLWESNALQLRNSSIPGENIHISNLCTVTEHRFFSHRRDATKGRNLALLML